MTNTNDDHTWGVRWEAAVLPDEGLPVVPGRPTYPEGLPPVTYDPVTGNPIPPEYTDEQQAALDEFNAQMAVFAEASAEWEQAVDALLTQDTSWSYTVATYASETDARTAFTELTTLHAPNKYARNFELVTAPPRTWTPVE